MRHLSCLLFVCSLLVGGALARGAGGATLTVELPAETKVASAVAVASGLKVESPGVINRTTLTFDHLLPATPYDIRLTLVDGSVVQGVNLDWYDDEAPAPDAPPLTDADRKEMLDILLIPDFYNKKSILLYKGTHERAATLVQLVRDTDFYAGGGQVIWRIELYYFKNQHGGWEKIAQQNKILRRERFKSHDAYLAATSKLTFLPALGGITLGAGEATKTVKLDTLKPPAPAADNPPEEK